MKDEKMKGLLQNILMICQIAACAFGIYGSLNGQSIYVYAAAAVLLAEEVTEIVLKLESNYLISAAGLIISALIGHLIGKMPFDLYLLATAYVVTSTILTSLGCIAKLLFLRAAAREKEQQKQPRKHYPPRKRHK